MFNEEIKTGSPEWFRQKSKDASIIVLQEKVENLREQFLNRFSPEVLAQMSGEDLLKEVFGNSPLSMVNLLMHDMGYRNFGAPGPYNYLFLLYQTKDGTWKYKEDVRKTPAETINRNEAQEKAKEIIEGLLYCVSMIEKTQPRTLADYEVLNRLLGEVRFYHYTGVLKYYQMVFPFFFAGMYAEPTLKRAIRILGLKGARNNFLRCGELSLFIRKCNVNDIAFNKIYSNEWDWEGDCPPCSNALENNQNRKIIVDVINKSLYKIPVAESAQDNIERAEQIEKEINELNLIGEVRNTYVKTRVNQDIFRSRLIKKYGKCCLCGISKETVLIASHIKSWVKCTPVEKLDSNNGFLLCPNHDKVFDRGLISFDDDGSIIISSKLGDIDKILLNLNIKKKMELNDSIKTYLKYHRDFIFDKNNDD